jgi:hypothetical protein
MSSGTTTTSSSASPTPTTTPESTLVFIVGHCAEWDEGRAATGDIQLDLCFRRYGARRVVFVKDNDCTKQNCELQLQRLLKTSRRNDTSVFSMVVIGTKVALKQLKKSGKVSRWYGQSIDTSMAIRYGVLSIAAIPDV